MGGGRAKDFLELEPEEPGRPRALDLRLDDESPPIPFRKEALKKVKEAEKREGRRLIYVALTRAVHHCSMYYVIKNQYQNNPLYPMLMGPVRVGEKFKKQADLDLYIKEKLHERFIHTPNEIVFDVVEELMPLTLLHEDESEETPLAAHSPPQPTNPHWKQASFSFLSEKRDKKQCLGQQAHGKRI